MPLRPLLAFALLFLAVGFAQRAAYVTRAQRIANRGLVGVGALGAGFLVAAPNWASVSLSLLSVIVLTRCFDWPRLKPEFSGHPLGAWIWFLHPPTAGWPEHVRLDLTAASRCLLRSALYVLSAVPALALVYSGPVFDAPLIDAPPPWLRSAAFCWGFATLSPAFVEVLALPAVLMGIPVAPIFNWPLVSRSPAEFWSRRWNLYVARFASRHVYLPLGGGRANWKAMGLVFLISGVMHEYVAIVACGSSGTFGYMTSFFLLQGAGVVAQHLVRRRLRWRRWPLPVALGVHFAWMVLTVPLFMIPLQPVLELLAYPKAWLH